MAEDKQLTVAELLARSRENNPDAEPPRRRRRRSLEEGGISVAELTGSFPAVEATPPEAKHSSVPLDAPAEDADAEAERKAAEKAEAERKAAEKAEAERKAAEKAEAERKAAEKAEAERKAAEKAEAERKAAEKAEAERKAAAEKKAAADKRAAEDRAILEEKARKEREAKAAASATPVSKQPSSDETTVISKVTEQPKPKDSTAPTAAAAAATETTAIPTVKAGEPKRRDHTDTATIDVVRVEDDDDRYADRRVEQVYADDDVDDWDEEDEGAGIGVIIGMALVGVVIGVLVFLGFELMWGQLNSWFVAALALAVTAVMVVATRALRTGRDVAAMALATVVGLVMTFGPAILVL